MTIPKTRKVYVCEMCSAGYFHPLVYCYKCPGRLKSRDLPWSETEKKGYFESDSNKTATQKLREWMKENDVTWAEMG